MFSLKSEFEVFEKARGENSKMGFDKLLGNKWRI
jgi:hypothetical protein